MGEPGRDGKGVDFDYLVCDFVIQTACYLYWSVKYIAQYSPFVFLYPC